MRDYLFSSRNSSYFHACFPDCSCQAYGEAGVIKIVQILEREMITGMRLLGATRVEELVPEMVSTLKYTSRFFVNMIVGREGGLATIIG